MANGKLIVICQLGGKFTTTGDGSLSYSGGDAHAMSVNKDTKFDDFKSEIGEMWKHDLSSITIKYLLPNNNRTLITISNDKDIQRMIEFHEDSTTVNVYIVTTHAAASDVPTMPCSRSSRTTAAGRASPVAPTDLVTYAEVIGWQKLTDTEEIEQQKLTASWKNNILGVDQQFNSVNELRDALHKYSLAHGFLYTFKSNDSTRVSVKCKTKGCPWLIHATKLSTTQLFRIRKMNRTHTCGVGTNAVCPRASKKLLASIVKEKLQNTPNYRPMEIVDEIRQDYGIEVGYAQAWRVMETAREELHGKCKEAFNQLPWLCEKIMETNPGSVTTLITRDDLSFHRLFVSYHASLYGFQNGCRPLLFLDNLTLKSKYQGELLSANALDGNDGIFPVAFAIVDVLSDDNWHWFLVQLEAVLQTSQFLTFVADRGKGISDSLPQMFKNCYHGYCLLHLTENLKGELKGPFTQEVVHAIVSELHNAAYAPTVEGFKKCVETMKCLSPEACEWIQQNKPEHWANAFFNGSRYNHVKSNVADSFYNWVSEFPALPIVEVIETMRRKLMELIYKCRVDSDEWSSRLTPSAEEKLRKITSNSRSVEVLFSPGSTYNVRDTLGVINVVNLDDWECSCREWQITGLPCLHAVAVIDCFGKNVYDYCSKYFTIETYRIAYSESINPVRTADGPIHTESSPVRVHPPSIRRPSGRPKEKRVRPEGEVKRPLHCSKCNKVGHNKVKCRQSS
ncbi:hypothetical protein L1049_016100 [Liquidambar formosana]|uniref:SWIM-type domain-containing protein n=1 Tax=Liquidambar formosana TaxID=63359 RepID=A0AAP0X6K1_LIQFO